MAHTVHIDTYEGRGGSTTARSTLLLAATAVAIFAFTLAGSAGGASDPPPVTLGPISVADGTAVVNGSVGGDPVAEATLEINGQPVAIDASGHFTAVVDLDGEAAVVLSLDNGNELVTIRIPLAALLENGGQGVLDALNDAGVSIDVPPDGFEVVDGQMPQISGSVLNRERLASLAVNDRDVLNMLGPDGTFSVVPGSSPSQHVTIVATDRQGVSQTSVFRTSEVKTTIKTVAGTSVSATGAQGVVIAKVRFVKRNLVAKKRLGVIVTVKDRRGYLIRGAALRLRGTPLRYLANGATRVGFTNRLGQAKFMYRLSKRAFTQKPRYLAVLTRASTPTASAKKRATLRLPMLLPT